MDRGMGKAASGAGGISTPTARPYGKLATTPIPLPGKPAAAKPPRQVLEGYVKNGVVHLLGGELPDGIFVKVVRE
jgi:probable phosphoglycerate mutase